MTAVAALEPRRTFRTGFAPFHGFMDLGQWHAFDAIRQWVATRPRIRAFVPDAAAANPAGLVMSDAATAVVGR